MLFTKIGQNTEKSPGGLRKFAVIRNYRRKPSVDAGLKNSQRSKIIIIIIIIIIAIIGTNVICPTQNLSWRMTHKLLWDFEIQTDHLISARRPDLIIINKKEKICRIVDFAVPADHRVKLKESKKKDKYLDLARELKKLWNMKMTIIPIVIGALGTVTKGLIQGLKDLEIRGQVETV